MQLNDEEVQLNGKVVAFTDRGVLIDIEGHGEEWFPKSQLDVDLDTDLMDLSRGEEIEFMLPGWIALERGIFDD